MIRSLIASSGFFLIALGSCGGGDTAEESAPAPELQRFTLAADPAAALSVADAKAAAPRKEVVAVGRIDKILKGMVAFTLVDASLEYCGEDPASQDNCATPWDYCCIAGPEKVKNTLLVEVRGDDGRPLATAGLQGLRLLDLVAVQGEAVKDEHGNVTIVAAGWFCRERPELRDDLRWPK